MHGLKNAVIYVRVSTEEQARSGEGLNDQERKCKEFAEKNGYTIIHIFREEGESGGTADRTQLKELLKLCTDKNSNVSFVICCKVDRFSRNVGDFAYLSKYLKKIGIEILFINGMNVDNHLGRFMLNIQASFAEFELGMITERINDGVKAAKNSGRYYHKTFGYSIGINKATNKKQIYPNEDAHKVKRIFELLDEGYNQLKVIEIMKKEYGIRIPPQTLEKRIKNILYCGLMRNSEGQEIKAIHEPIISEELFRSVQNRLNKRSSNNKNRNYANPIFPLIDYIYCDAEGHKMTGSLAQKKYPYYHCQGKCCRYPKQKAEEAYLNHLGTLKIKEEHIEMVRQISADIYEQKTTNITEQNKRLNTEIAELEKQQLATFQSIRDEADDTMKKLGKKELARLTALVQEKKGYLMDEEKINRIADECWDFVKFFMSNTDVIWEMGNLEIKKGVQSLISPKGFIFNEKVIELKETPDFISSFKSAPNENPLRWRWRELNPRPKMLQYDRYRLSPEDFSRL